jgi:curved DNA-binding protein CbpA
MPPEAEDTYYDIIGVPPTANPEKIKRAYKKLALELHPDKNPGNENEANPKFQKLGQAYDTLKDPSKRRAYDRTLPPVEHSAVPPRAESAAASATGNQYRSQTPNLQSQVEELCQRYETGQMARADFERQYSNVMVTRAYDRLPEILRQRFSDLHWYGPGRIIVQETQRQVEELCQRYETGQMARADFESQYSSVVITRAYDRLPEILRQRFSDLHRYGVVIVKESEAIIRDAKKLAKADPDNPLLERFNDFMSQAKSIENEQDRQKTINALHELVPENVLRRLNQYDQEWKEVRSGVRDAKQTRASLGVFYDDFWRLGRPVTQQLLLSVNRRSGVQSNLSDRSSNAEPGPGPRTAANRATSQGGHSYSPPAQQSSPASQNLAHLRAQQKSHGRGRSCSIM